MIGDGIKVGIGAETAGFRAGLEKTKASTEKFRQSVGKKLKSTFTGGFTAAAVTGTTFGLVLDNLLDKYDAIAKSARRAGIDPEVFQRQAHAFKKADIELNDYTNAVIRMGRKTVEAAQGNKTLQAAFSDLNIDIERFKELKPDEQILALADAYAEADDKQVAFAALFKVLEDDAKKFRDAFSGGAAEIKKSGDSLENVVSEKALRNIERFNDMVTDMKANLAGLAVGVVDKAAGAIDTASVIAREKGVRTAARHLAEKNGTTYDEELAKLRERHRQMIATEEYGMSEEDLNRTEEERQRIMEENRIQYEREAEQMRNQIADQARASAALNQTNNGAAMQDPTGDGEAAREIRELTRVMTSDGIRLKPDTF